MEQKLKQVFIVNNRAETLHWDAYGKDRNQNSRTVLYDTENVKFKIASLNLSAEGNPNQDILKLIEQTFNTSTGRNFIEFVSTYNNPDEVCKVWLRITLEDDVLKTFCDSLTEPNIVVKSFFSNKSIPFETVIKLSKTKSLRNFESAVETFPRKNYPSGYCLDKITYSVLLEWKEQATSRINRHNVLGSLFTDKTLADCWIRSADNTEIRCHGSILATNSDVFHAMLTNGLQESQTQVIEMADLSNKTVSELLAYLYGLEINPFKMQEEMAFNLLRVAHKYNISSLEEDMLETLLNKPNHGFSMDTVLALYYFTVNIQQFSKLCEKTLNILRRNPKNLVSSPAYKDLLKTNAEEAAKLALKLLELGSN